MDRFRKDRFDGFIRAHRMLRWNIANPTPFQCDAGQWRASSPMHRRVHDSAGIK